MIDGQSLSYALIQVAHNFGAASVVGGAAAALWLVQESPTAQRKLAWLVLIAWAIQATSGAGFGAISYLYYGQFPDIHGIAIAALLLKIACAIAGFLLAGAYLVYGGKWNDGVRRHAWEVLLGLGATALMAAAFLRWFS